MSPRSAMYDTLTWHNDYDNMTYDRLTMTTWHYDTMTYSAILLTQKLYINNSYTFTIQIRDNMDNINVTNK